MAVHALGTGDYVLDDIRASVMALNYLDPKAGDSVEFYLYQAASGGPGQVIESFEATAPNSYPPGVHPITTVVSAAHPILTGGDTYWFGLGPAANSVSDYWLLSDQNIQGVGALLVPGNSSWVLSPTAYTENAFRILGEQAAPEPSTVVPLLASTALCAYGLQRRRTGHSPGSTN